ncbi:PH domain-containing protein [Natrinema longum]|uniref:PH domain-containing protein n=1 Tax=Natrinema longum TaxID=370324 RepID=A0A8A2U9B7_9EURY|nr:PH domain-containing protein [Natrinema longum]MBZ6496715.1 PH domain-containing protein [Natrinema longum]QSW85391.1 PH domain-containing protein [Natrinema longum]
MERLTPRVRVVWLVFSLLRAAIFGGLVVGAAVALTRTAVWDSPPSVLVPAAVGFAFFIAIAGVLVAWARYGVWRFDLRDDDLYIEHGVFTRIKTVVPYVRVQHVDSRRSPLERTTGLATVVVYTAGSRSSDVAIPGLTPERAEDLQESLRRLAIESEGEDAV